MDNDSAGRDAYDQAVKLELLRDADVNFVSCRGMPDSELEDTYKPNSYADSLNREFGVNLNVGEFRSNRKWSDRMRVVFQTQGKRWDERAEAKAKAVVARAIGANPQAALIPQKSLALKALAEALAAKLNKLSQTPS